jgi:hypothetical protein
MNGVLVPYYKVTTHLGDEGKSLVVRVNGIPHQRVTTAALRERQQPQYVIPYRGLVGNPLNDVLIVGAGTGTDVAIALRRGAKRIRAELPGQVVDAPDVGTGDTSSSAATSRSIDWSSTSRPDRACERGNSIQWPKERSPMRLVAPESKRVAASGIPGQKSPRSSPPSTASVTPVM